MLLTGDAEAAVEGALVAGGWDLGAGLLKVGHHGSRTSTTPEFLRAVGPGLAAVSSGRSNPWGHPDREVIDRLTAAGARVFRTDRDGAMRFVADDSGGWRAVPAGAVRPLRSPGWPASGR